jgi:hypothetical protein
MLHLPITTPLKIDTGSKPETLPTRSSQYSRRFIHVSEEAITHCVTHSNESTYSNKNSTKSSNVLWLVSRRTNNKATPKLQRELDRGHKTLVTSL